MTGLLWILFALTLAPLSVVAQTGPPVDRVAALWAREAAGDLGALLAGSVRLDLDGERHVGISPRQVSARLDRLFGRFEPAPLELIRDGVLAEDRDRAFAEFRWAPAPTGTAEPTSRIVYVGFRREGSSWRIVELRLLN